MVGDENSGLGRSGISVARRLDLIEKDLANHAKSLTALVEQVQGGFTPEQMEQLRVAFHDGLAEVGMRADDPDHQDQAREDFRFLRRIRTGVDGLASKVGWFVIAAALAAVFGIVQLGIQAWKSMP